MTVPPLKTSQAGSNIKTLFHYSNTNGKKNQIKWCLGPCSPLPQILNRMSQGPCILKKLEEGFMESIALHLIFRTHMWE